MKPTDIFHADWGTAANKRWFSRATLGADGRYTAHVPTHVGDPSCLISLIRNEIRDDGVVLVGFDFPIGIPTDYARLAGVTEFKTFLRELGNGAWADFYSVATVRSEISVRRPFYPFSPGGKKQAHLLNALAVQSIDELRRECEREQPRRRSACSLFWTLGANQVGKAAIVGWRDVLAPGSE